MCSQTSLTTLSFRFISEYKYSIAVGDPLPVNLKIAL